jgi:probable cytosol aminopeptidase
LDKFIKEDFKDKWLHLDIAGPAYLEKAWGYNQIGATGAAIRAVIYYLKALAKPSCGCDKKGA